MSPSIRNPIICGCANSVGGYNNIAVGCNSIAMGHNTCMQMPNSNMEPLTYISLVKRIGQTWKIELTESTDLQSHLRYIESLRGNPNIEEAKVMQFTKVAGFTILTEKKESHGGEPNLDKIL